MSEAIPNFWLGLKIVTHHWRSASAVGTMQAVMVDFGPAANLVISALSATVVFFALDLWRLLAEAFGAQGVGGARTTARAGAVLAAWLALAFLATFVPALGAAIVSVPALPMALFVGIVAGLTWLGLTSAGRRAFDGIAFKSLLSFFYWRAIFGALLLAAYAAGRLPAAFGVPAGLGDMAVTLLAVVLLTAKPASGELARVPLLLWNALGLVDLLAVLVLGVTVLRPWVAQHGLAAPNFTLQLFVVPLFVAVHIQIFGRLWRERRSAQTHTV